MTQPMPTGSGPTCGFGFCDKPATAHVVIHYPAKGSTDSFEWRGWRCADDLAVEKAAAATVGGWVDVNPTTPAQVEVSA